MGNNRQIRQPLPEVREKDNNLQKSWKGFWIILVAIVGFSLASQFISLKIPRTISTLDLPALEPKLEDMKREGRKYDFVFLGSSRIFRGVNPMEIDAEAKKLACNIKTYNFGIAGLSLLEQKYILNRLQESKVDIGTIIIEPYSVLDSTLDGYISDRRRYFYTLDNLPDLLLDQFTMPGNILYKARNVAYFLFGFMREQTGVGRLSHILFPQKPKAVDLWNKPIHRGYMPFDEETGEAFDMRKQQLMRSKNKFNEKIKNATNNPTLKNSSGDRFKLVRSVIDRIRNQNIQPAILFMPNPRSIKHSRDLEKQLTNDKSIGNIPIINLNRPEYYSDLFAIDNFFDGSHLNRQGGLVLARYLAPKLCALQTSN